MKENKNEKTPVIQKIMVFILLVKTYILYKVYVKDGIIHVKSRLLPHYLIVLILSPFILLFGGVIGFINIIRELHFNRKLILKVKLNQSLTFIKRLKFAVIMINDQDKIFKTFQYEK